MESIGERIVAILDALGLKKIDMARRLKISSPSVTTMCNGKTKPSGQTITMICNEFNVNEHWLRTGEGEMFIKQSRNEQISAFVQNAMSSESDNFKKRFISMLAQLDEHEWAVLEQMVNILTNSENDSTN